MMRRTFTPVDRQQSQKLYGTTKPPVRLYRPSVIANPESQARGRSAVNFYLIPCMRRYNVDADG